MLILGDCVAEVRIKVILKSLTVTIEAMWLHTHIMAPITQHRELLKWVVLLVIAITAMAVLNISTAIIQGHLLVVTVVAYVEMLLLVS